MDLDDTYFRFTSLQDQVLITEIQKYPALFYPKHTDYKNCNVKDDIWKKVAVKVGRKVEDCRNRWRNVKDTYFRVKKRRDSRGNTEPYRPKKWDEKLSFLDKCYKPYRYSRNSSYSRDEEIPTSSQETSDNCVEDEILNSMETLESKEEELWFLNRFTYEEDHMLVTQVSKRPALYRNRHPHNKVPHAKERMWKEVAAAVGRSDVEVKKRFRNIRDGYLKQIKAESKNPTGKLLNCRRNRSLYEKLSFLNPYYAASRTILATQVDDNNQTMEEKPTEEMSEDSDSEEKNETSVENSIIFVETLDDSFQGVEVQSDSSDENEIDVKTAVTSGGEQTVSAQLSDSLSFSEKKSKKELVNSLLEELQKKMSKKEDDVDLFLKSVGIAMKKLPTPLVTEAKIKILQLVSNLETKAVQN